jgi:hypothetical protein
MRFVARLLALFSAHTMPSVQRCACDAGCPNRVAQRPRAVPIEVYKTRAKGWAVRAAQDLPVGKVLGVFTGYVPALMSHAPGSSCAPQKTHVRPVSGVRCPD